MRVKKALIILSGDDFSIIQKCSKGRQNWFAAIGAFVALIFIYCFVSSYFAFTKLFNTYFIGLFLAIFFALMITNIYLLILYTLSKNVLPSKKSFSGGLFSKCVRVGFMCLIALIVSKPMELLVYSSSINQDLARYKAEKIRRYITITEEFYQAEKSELEKEIDKYSRIPGGVGMDSVKLLQDKLQQAEEQKNLHIRNMQDKVSKSSYFILSISILNNNYPWCWVLSLLSILIFLGPAILKFLVSGNFYQIKKKVETTIILEEYAKFKNTYSQLLRKYSRQPISFYELYADPPFNTRRKLDNRVFSSEKDLISDLYHD